MCEILPIRTHVRNQYKGTACGLYVLFCYQGLKLVAIFIFATCFSHLLLWLMFYLSGTDILIRAASWVAHMMDQCC